MSNLAELRSVLHVAEKIANRGLDKFANLPESRRRKLFPPSVRNKIVEPVRIGQIFKLREYRGKLNGTIELIPLHFSEKGPSVLFVPYWAMRPHGLHFKIFLTIVPTVAANGQTITFRYEMPENRGRHAFWHMQLSYLPEAAAVATGDDGGIPVFSWLPTKDPAVPLPSEGDSVDLLLNALISIYGYDEKIKAEIAKCGFDGSLYNLIVKRVQKLVA